MYMLSLYNLVLITEPKHVPALDFSISKWCFFDIFFSGMSCYVYQAFQIFVPSTPQAALFSFQKQFCTSDFISNYVYLKCIYFT